VRNLNLRHGIIQLDNLPCKCEHVCNSLTDGLVSSPKFKILWSIIENDILNYVLELLNDYEVFLNQEHRDMLKEIWKR